MNDSTGGADPNWGGRDQGGRDQGGHDQGGRDSQSVPPPPGEPGGSAGPADHGTGFPGSGGATPPLQPMGVGDVLDGTVRSLLGDWRVLLGAVAAVMIPMQLVILAIAPDFVTTGPVSAFTEAFEEPGAVEQDFDVVFGPAGVSALLPLALAAQFLVVAPLVAGTVTHIVGHRRMGRPTDVGAALRAALGRLHVLVTVRVLLMLFVIAVTFLFGLLATVMGAGLGAIAAVIILPLGLAIAAAVAGGLVLFAVVTPAIVLERRGPLAALGRSARLVGRRFWPTTGRVLLVVLLVGIVTQVLTLVAAPFELVPGEVAFVATSTLVEIATSPLLPIALTLVYFDLRVRTEGLDFRLALDAGDGPRAG